MRKGKVLACQRKTSSLWGYPGGKIDTGESPLDAIQREIQEETGLVIAAKDCHFFYEGICLNKDPADRPFWVYSFICHILEEQEPQQMLGEPPFAWLFPSEFLALSAFPEFNELTLARASHFSPPA
jgi:8-oxo-dGTP diphosphatase